MEMPTGKTIQTLRRQKGLTQEQLAEAVGVTAAAVSKWETAHSTEGAIFYAARKV